MKVLEIRQMLRYGNLGRLIVRTAASLQTRGFAVDVLLLYNRSRARLLGVDETTLPLVHPLIADAEEMGVKAWQTMDHGPLSPQPLLSIWRALQRDRYDLLHTHDLKSNVFGLLAGKLANIPVIATAHGYPRSILRNEIYRYLDLLALRLCRHVVCVSDGLRRELLAAGLESGRMTVVHNGIAVDEVERRAASVPHTLRHDLGLAPHDVIVMAVGRLSAEKGHIFVLRALSLVMAQIPQVCLVVVGDGPLRDDLLSEARRLSVSERVFFLGFQVDALALMAQCDLLVNPSLGEALGNVVLEGMALAKPVIGAATGGIPEVIDDGETGVLVPPANAEALAAAMARLINDPATAQTLGQRARDHVLASFTIERMADGLANVFHSC